MASHSFVASVLVALVVLGLVRFVADVSETVRDVDPYARTRSGVQAHPSTQAAGVVVADGRAFDEGEWEAIERADSYLAANPDACVDDLLLDVRPIARCGRLSARAWWADVVAPGLAAETDRDLDPVRSGVRATPSTALRERASDLPGSPFGDAPAFRERYALTRPRDDGDDAFDASLPGPFSVVDVDAAERRAMVDGAGERAAFEVVDRDGAVAVAPVSESYRRDAAAGPPAEWFVDAADALEDALPEQYDALTDPASPWPSIAGSQETGPGASGDGPPVVDPVVHPPPLDAFDCTVHRGPNPSAEDEAETGPSDATTATDDARTIVDVTAGGDREALLVDDDGVVRFSSTDARRAHDRDWATRAVAAADAAVHDRPDH
ncbi:hypothetical protein [Halorubellus salinus]|uniref:hypothetical protein n=1 Tax=Halorubellus salinus TaxID=755309 RepID=UPI001D07685B|nr:hypothetical protein [Halorubellus salinus]